MKQIYKCTSFEENMLEERKSINQRIPWEFAFFKTMSSSFEHNIAIEDLYMSYKEVMDLHGLEPQSEEWIVSHLKNIKLPTGEPLTCDIHGNSIINYSAYSKSLAAYVKIKKYYEEIDTNKIIFDRSGITLKSHILLFITSLLDVLINSIILASDSNVPTRLIIARSSAVLILTNMAYLLIPLVERFTSVPDSVIVHLLDTERSSFYHKVFGIKILIGSIIHIIGHIAHIHHAINICRNGCLRKTIRIVEWSSEQTFISFQYFFKQYPYITGCLLTLIITIQFISILLSSKQCFRYATNQLIHKYLAIAVFITTILHGASHLLSWNYSLLFILPWFVLFCWKRRFQVIPKYATISRWTVSNSLLRIYLKDDHEFDKQLNSFGNVSVYINHPTLSKLEWHPFTLSRGYLSSDAVLTMKRVGKWTNELASLLLTNSRESSRIRIGHFIRSKFRYHRLYRNRYFFCAGIGITAFMSALHDMKRDPINHSTKTTLIWSVSDLSLLNEFGAYIMNLKSSMNNVFIKIYYSNRSKKKAEPLVNDLTRFDYLQIIMYAHYQVDILNGKHGPICCVLHRADILNILASVAATEDAQNTIGVFVCGSSSYVKHVMTSVNLVNKNERGLAFRVWAECA